MKRIINSWKPPEQFVEQQGTFKPNGFGRQFLSTANVLHRSEAFAAFGFDDISPEPVYQNFIGEHILDGAHTHRHQDTAPEGFIHVRANWMLKKPGSGGDPILDGKVIPVNEGDLWICFASEEYHASTPIQGGIRRICSFGALVPKPKNFNIKEVFS